MHGHNGIYMSYVEKKHIYVMHNAQSQWNIYELCAKKHIYALHNGQPVGNPMETLLPNFQTQRDILLS